MLATCVTVYFLVQPTLRLALVERTAQRDLAQIEWTLEHAAVPCELVTGRPLTVDEARQTFLSGRTSACQAQPRSQPLFPGKDVWLAALVSIFLHGGLLHLAGNMLYLWIFGDDIEARMGHLLYAVFYVASGVAATVAHVLTDPASTVPIVGASGAIAGVMGAYLMLYPRTPILSYVPLFPFGFLAEVPARWVLGLWFVSQFFISPTSGVAWAAHVGGFVFGALVALPLREPPRPQPVVVVRGPARRR